MFEDQDKYESLVYILVKCTVIMAHTIDQYIPEHLSGDFSYRREDKRVVEEILTPAIARYITIAGDYIARLEHMMNLTNSSGVKYNVHAARINYEHIAHIFMRLVTNQGD